MVGLHRVSRGLVGAALVVAGMTVHADGFYGGAAVARTEVKDLCNDLSAVVALASCDESSTGWRVFLGYRFARYFGAEFEYSSFGDSGVEVTTTSGVNLSAYWWDVEATRSWPWAVRRGEAASPAARAAVSGARRRRGRLAPRRRGPSSPREGPPSRARRAVRRAGPPPGGRRR